MKGKIPSVGVVVFDFNRVLLVCHGEAAQHFTGVWGLPSGRIEEGETPVKAAARELREETGIVAKRIFRLPTTYEAVLDGKTGPRDFHWILFHCTVWTGELAGDEKTTPEWVEIREIDRYELLPNVKNAIDEALTFR